MAENFGDKTEAPTPRRRQEAREQGNIARSQDLTASVLLLGMLLLLSWYGPKVVTVLKTLLQQGLGFESIGDFTTHSAPQSFVQAIIMASGALAPIFIGLAVLAVLANVMQVGWFISSKRIRPNLAALNPFKGLQRIFGGGPGFMQLAMNLVKLTLVTTVAYSAIHGRLAQIVMVQQLDFMQIFGMGTGIIYSIGMRIGILLLILAILDYFYQRFRIAKQLKMTKEEVKEEMRRMEGDPKIKARRRQIQMQMAMQRLKKIVPTADVVVTNPTEFAVALKYDVSTMHAPRVVAKGRGYLAQRIRELAISNGIPILERKPLARALYKLVDVGQEIPEQFYAAVAEILAYVYELTGKLKRAG